MTKRDKLEKEHCPDRRLELAQAYIPFQNYGPRFEPMEALSKGTLFIDLYRPYKRKRI